MATNTVTPEQIYAALTGAGATSAQAEGIMGNMVSESSLNPEASGLDSNGAWSYGLIEWNEDSFSNANTLVTGNPTADLHSQIQELISTGGLADATGSTPEDVASNFAHSYERCAACGYNEGSSQLTARADNAATIAQEVSTGNWAVGAAQNYSGTTPGTTGQGPAATTFAPTGIGDAILGYLDGFFNPKVSAVSGIANTLTDANGIIGGVATIVDRAIGVILGAGFVYIGIKMLSSGSWRSTVGVVQRQQEIGLNRQAETRRAGPGQYAPPAPLRGYTTTTTKTRYNKAGSNIGQTVQETNRVPYMQETTNT